MSLNDGLFMMDGPQVTHPLDIPIFLYAYDFSSQEEKPAKATWAILVSNARASLVKKRSRWCGLYKPETCRHEAARMQIDATKPEIEWPFCWFK